MEGVVGGYHGDIAISDAVLSVNDSCSFAPQEAQPNSFGMSSSLQSCQMKCRNLVRKRKEKRNLFGCKIKEAMVVTKTRSFQNF